MAKSHSSADDTFEEQEDYTEMEGSDYSDYDSDDTEQDPTYILHLSDSLSNLSIKSKSKSRNYAKAVTYDDEDSDKEMSAPKLGINDLKSLEEIERIIDCGQVEKLKVEQCKVYLRKHGLRLTGKKDTLIQRIKEHLEIVNGGGEHKYPPSSFVMNCKGDACMGDIVMFQQTVYEGYNIASRSAVGPPCGKRTVAGRIVKESYGAAKQQHTFTVEVLWSKGDKPLRPLHPLLIKGRNLYRLNTLRQRWEDESQRQRVLNEKHSRGSLARSNREARIQEKELKKNSKSIRCLSKDQKHPFQVKNRKHSTDQVFIHEPKLERKSKNQISEATTNAQKQQIKQSEQKLSSAIEFKENICPLIPVNQQTQPNKQNLVPSLYREPTSLAYKHQNSHKSSFTPPKLQGLAHYGHPRQCWEHQENVVQPVRYHQSFQQEVCSENRSFVTSSQFYSVYSDNSQNFQRQSWSAKHILRPNGTLLQNFERRTEQTQQPCRYYSRGKCYYGDQCRYRHG